MLIADAFSFPDPIAEMDEAEYLRWRMDAINFAKEDAVRKGAEVLSITEHCERSHHDQVIGLDQANSVPSPR